MIKYQTKNQTGVKLESNFSICSIVCEPSCRKIALCGNRTLCQSVIKEKQTKLGVIFQSTKFSGTLKLFMLYAWNYNVLKQAAVFHVFADVINYSYKDSENLEDF